MRISARFPAKLTLWVLAAVAGLPLVDARPANYSVANAHSHNDYEQHLPFHQAFAAGFGSIEADIILQNGELYVAHSRKDIDPRRTLEELYLRPIATAFRNGEGWPFQLLLDLKTDASTTLPILAQQLRSFPELFNTDPKSPAVEVVISGSRPEPDTWPDAPVVFRFDGRPSEAYSPATLQRTGLISDSFKKYSRWDGTGTVSEDDKKILTEVVKEAHTTGKPFRFWAVPDTPEAWALMTELGVDFINTDAIDALAAWLTES